ncbi:uncharacterized protein LOC113290836 [Papaver somniferum]|uniref:uncharacterized protein LOC113290836 n=1 Tax=Papaver somniferum TaxID=3469 RepID=UPI000E6FF79B|nr:uncharacterized protein LOC113290836 [Papaver somniferum]
MVEQRLFARVIPIVFQAVKDKDASISDMLGATCWNSAFKKTLDASEQLEWDLLKRDLSFLPTLVDAEDEMTIMENFNTQRCYEILAGDYEACNFEQNLWKSNVPHKVSFILWATFHNSLPTRDMLIHRDMDIENDLCPLCNTEKESAEHMFMHCAYFFEIWDYFIITFKISWPLPATSLQLFDAWKTSVMNGRAREIWKIIHYAICWMLWKEIN